MGPAWYYLCDMYKIASAKAAPCDPNQYSRHCNVIVLCHSIICSYIYTYIYIYSIYIYTQYTAVNQSHTLKFHNSFPPRGAQASQDSPASAAWRSRRRSSRGRAWAPPASFGCSEPELWPRPLRKRMCFFCIYITIISNMTCMYICICIYIYKYILIARLDWDRLYDIICT